MADPSIINNRFFNLILRTPVFDKPLPSAKNWYPEISFETSSFYYNSDQGASKKLNSLLMLRFLWNLIFLYEKLDEKIDSASIFVHFLVFLEKIMIFCWKKWFFSDLDMFTQFEFEVTIFTLKQIQSVLKSWKYFQQNHGSGFFKFIFDFLLWLKMYLNIGKPSFFEIYHICQCINEST